jgi:hypothetical protein
MATVTTDKVLPLASPIGGQERSGLVRSRSGPFALGPDTICVEAFAVAYMEQLSGLGFEVIPAPFREVSMFGGGFHCSTVEIHREGDMEVYFDEADPRLLRQGGSIRLKRTRAGLLSSARLTV